MSYRPVYGGLRSARWLRSFKYGPMVTAFRNLETGQVLFTQTLHPQQFYIDQQFRWPNWQNRRPSVRRDIWRILAVTQMQTYEQAVALYRNLVELRSMRDMQMRKEARAWRYKNNEGNTWFWNQYRPTYTYEAVSDIISSLIAMDAPAKIHWAEEYLRGKPELWADLQVEHGTLPRHNPRYQYVVLNRIRAESLSAASEAEKVLADAAERAAADARSKGLPTAEELRQSELQKYLQLREEQRKAREAAHAALLKSRPELADIEEKRLVVERAEQALAAAKAAFDPFTPRGQRGAAKAPIKMRDRALRQAKRVYRAAVKKLRRRQRKGRVPQPRIRLLQTTAS